MESPLQKNLFVVERFIHSSASFFEINQKNDSKDDNYRPSVVNLKSQWMSSLNWKKMLLSKGDSKRVTAGVSWEFWLAVN